MTTHEALEIVWDLADQNALTLKDLYDNPELEREQKRQRAALDIVADLIPEYIGQ